MYAKLENMGYIWNKTVPKKEYRCKPRCPIFTSFLCHHDKCNQRPLGPRDQKSRVASTPRHPGPKKKLLRNRLVNKKISRSCLMWSSGGQVDKWWCSPFIQAQDSPEREVHGILVESEQGAGDGPQEVRKQID